jgi:hypothetical protein
VLPWVAVRVFESVTADDLGEAPVPLPLDLGDEIAVQRHPAPLEVVDLCGRRLAAPIAELEEYARRIAARSRTVRWPSRPVTPANVRKARQRACSGHR